MAALFDSYLLNGTVGVRRNGTSGDDTLEGTAGDDRLDGGDGNDTLNGYGGDDDLFGGAGADILNGGDGIDTASYASASSGVIVDALDTSRNTGDALGDVYIDIENWFGSHFDDDVSGDNGANLIAGLDGDDLLNGAGGNDRLLGGDGADTLIGGAGNDQLFGQGGADIFSFGDDDGDNVIYDFEDGVDRIELTGLGTEASAFSARQVGAHVEITAGNTTILVRNLNVNSLEATDFILAENDPSIDSVFLRDISTDIGLRVPGLVTSIGDVNGDGVMDFQTRLGSSASNYERYVVFGREDGEFPLDLDVETLSPDEGYAYDGVISSAGDVNGDGFQDFIVGNAVVFGDADGFDANTDLTTLDGSDGFTFSIFPASQFEFGRAIGLAGDLNGDGIDDLYVTDPLADPNGESNVGATYILFGSDSGFQSDYQPSDFTFGVGSTITGIVAGDRAGGSVAAIGDFNGDGIDDFLIGAPGAGPGANLAGEAYLIYGREGGISSQIDLGNLDGIDGTLITGFPRGGLGGTVAGIGDFNGDGLADILLEANNADSGNGALYRIYGVEGGLGAEFSLESLNGVNGERIGLSNFHGDVISSVGDINNDGFADYIVGLPNNYWELAATLDPITIGSAVVVLGGPTGPNGEVEPTDSFSLLPPSLGFSYLDITPTSGLGRYVAPLGDINGDGIDDFAVFAFSRGFDSQEATSFIIFGFETMALPDIVRVLGSSDNDVLFLGSRSTDAYGLAGNDRIVGNSLDNLIVGAAGNDRLFGLDGDDYLIGGDGNDDFYGGSGADRIHGDAGRDRAFYVFADSAVVVDVLTQSRNSGEARGDTLLSIEQVFGSRYSDQLLADHSGMTLVGMGGHDILIGRNGRDTLIGGDDNDRLDGGRQNDTLIGGSGSDTFVIGVGAGRDTILDFEQGIDLIELRSGSGDLSDMDIRISGNNTIINHANGILTLSGFTGQLTNADFNFVNPLPSPTGISRTFTLTDRNDTEIFGADDDTVFAGSGNDTIRGGSGDDSLFGEAGNDTLFGGSGADLLDGGEGVDRAMYTLASSGVVVSLTNAAINQGEAEGDTFVSIENVYGSNYNDLIYGDSGDNVLAGLDDDDFLIGYGGDDTLLGGDGNDRLQGEQGRDVLIGGEGADTFIFRASSGRDQITDFEDGTDLIQFRGASFDFDDLSITQVGNHAQVESDFGTILLLNFDADLLTVEDFLFG